MSGKNKHHTAPKRRNKAYVPKANLRGGGLQLISAGIAAADARALARLPLDAEDVTDVSTKYWMSLEQLKTGKATEQAWGYVTTGANFTLGMCEHGLGREHIPAVILALEALLRAKVRGDTAGAYRLDGPGIAAVTDMLHIHDAQLAEATPADVFAAERILEQRIRAGNVYTAPPTLLAA